MRGPLSPDSAGPGGAIEAGAPAPRWSRYGERGRPLLYVPSSSGDETEFERYGLPEAARPWIAAGRVQLFAVDGRAPATLWNDALDPPSRMRRYAEFERALKERVIPEILELSDASRIAVLGVSYGGFVAANLAFKRPDLVDVAGGLGGVYGLWHRLDGHHDDEVYFHTPLEFLPRLEEPDTLNAIRRGEGFHLYAGADDEWLESSTRLAEVLRDRDLPHSIEVWPSPACHQEIWWRRQLPRFLARIAGPV